VLGATLEFIDIFIMTANCTYISSVVYEMTLYRFNKYLYFFNV